MADGLPAWICPITLRGRAVVTEAHEDVSGVGERPRHQARDGHHGQHEGGAREHAHDAGHQPQHENAQRGNKWWTLVAVCVGTFMLLLDITIVNVALPDIQHALHSSFADLQWVVDAYALTLAAFLLTAGSLADMYGRRLMYLVGLVIFTAASALCGFATSTLMLQLSRGLQGVGGAIMFAVSLALLADAFRGKERGIAFGIWGGVTGLAVAIGPLAGGLLTTGLSWRWIFFVNVPLGIAAVVIAALRVSESRAPQASGPDWLGFVAVHRGAGEPGLRADRVQPGAPSATTLSSAVSRWRRSCSSPSSSSNCAFRIRCSTSACSSSRRSPAARSPRSASARRSSRCCSTSCCTSRTSWASRRWGPVCGSW